jgi:glycerol-3-phosphate dehydrogenase (NAD(P)+)
VGEDAEKRVNRGEPMSYVAVLGAGSWGTTLAKVLAGKGLDVSMWVLEEDVAKEIRNSGYNSTYLPGVHLPDNIKPYTDIAEAINTARYILNVVPVQHTRKVLEQAIPLIDKETVIINASKGIEVETYKTISVIARELGHASLATLSGPSFAAEVSKQKPTAVTLACEDTSTSLLLQELFNTDYFRVYSHDDVIGTELGGALKNVIAVASGISEGMELGNSARAALITRGLAEMTRFGLKLGAKEHTFYGLSGMGDLVLTCNSTLSRNFTVGIQLGQGKTLREIMEGRKTVAEGVHTAKAAYELGRQHNVDMPIIEQIYQVVYEEKNPCKALHDLMTRVPKPEFNG